MSTPFISPATLGTRYGADQIDVFMDAPVVPKRIEYQVASPRILTSERIKRVTPDQAIQKWLAGFAPAYKVYRAPTVAKQPPDVKRYLTWQLMSTDRYERDEVMLKAGPRHDDIDIDVSNHATSQLDLNFYGDGSEEAIHTLLASRHAITAIQALRAGGLSMGDVSPVQDLTALDLVDYKLRFQVTMTLNRRIDGRTGIERIKEIDLGGKWVDGGKNIPDNIHWKEVPAP